MTRLNPDNLQIAKEIISRYPVPRSALVPLLHLAQSQDGHVTEDAMEHIAELVGITPAEVLGTCSFYEMFKREPVGDYLVNICHGISCHLLGAAELIAHASEMLGVEVGGTTDDGRITLEAVECIAACTEAPCLQVNYRYRHRVSANDFNEMVAGLRNGDRHVPPHGTLARIRQSIDPERAAGVSSPAVSVEPAWMARNPDSEAGA